MSATKNINIEKISGLAKTNLSATTSPTSTDDINAGYGVGSFWVDTVTGKVYFCTDATVGSAVWVDVSSSGGISDGDKGDITVSSGGSTWTIDNSVITLAKMADVDTATLFYRKTGGTGSPEVQTLATLKTDLGLTGTNSGDQTITLTNDVTGSGTGSFATTISNDAVTNAKLANMAQTTIKGRASGSGTGDPTDLNASQVLEIIKTVDGSASGLDADLLDGVQGSQYLQKTSNFLSKTFTLEAPTASDDITIFRTDVAITVQEVIAVSVGTSPSTTYRLRHHTDRNNTGNLLTTLAATTSTTTGNVATLSDATIPANSWIWFESTAASGTNVKLTIDIRYTID